MKILKIDVLDWDPDIQDWMIDKFGDKENFANNKECTVNMKSDNDSLYWELIFRDDDQAMEFALRFL